MFLQAVHVVAQRGRLGFECRSIGAGSLTLTDLTGKRIYAAGHTRMAGSAVAVAP